MSFVFQRSTRLDNITGHGITPREWGNSMGWFATRAVRAAGCLLISGCALIHQPIVPTAELRDRILPPPIDQSDLPATLPSLGAPVAVDRPFFAEDTPSSRTPLTLEEAIDIALRANPRIEMLRERIAQAEGGRLVAFSEFMPHARALYRPIAGSSNTLFGVPTIPTYAGNVSFGGTAERFSLAELHLEWILWDFGRSTGRFGQAVNQVDIARQQYERSRQTAAYNVTTAYFDVLRARALHRVADEAVRRAETVLRDARNFLKRGVAVRNDVLRAEVLLAESRVQLVKARTAEGIAVAGLNREMGINVSSDTRVVDRLADPSLATDVPGALLLAAENRPEFRVVLDAIRVAGLGAEVAHSDFYPKITVGGVAAQLDSNIAKDVTLAAAGVTFELSLFEGGKRVGQLRSSRAEARAVLAQGKEVCDTIAFEVQSAYLLTEDARQRISLSRAALSAATENLRIVRNLFDRGDATPTEVVDAELAMTRAQQEALTALYDYQTALARLAYAAGVPSLR